MSLKRNLLIIAILLACFILITFNIVNQNSFVLAFDQNIAYIFGNLRSPVLDDAMVFITKIGDPYQCLVIFGLLSIFLLKKHKKYRFYVISIATALGTILPQTIKMLVEKTRPVSQLVLETDYSFPSGHATVSAVYLISIVFLVIPLIKNAFIRRLSLTAAIIIFPLIALSRMYLSVHWASDVIAGVFLGLACYFISFTLVFHKHIAVK